MRTHFKGSFKVKLCAETAGTMPTAQSIRKENKVYSTADFCLNNCPHPECECTGDCPEFKKWRKENHHGSK